MLVDDSVVARRVLARIFEEDGRFRVTGSHASGDLAIAALRNNRADMILLDLEMPGRNGIDCLSDLLDVQKDATIVILSAHHPESGTLAVSAQERGAREVLRKPMGGHFNPAFASALTDRLYALHHHEEGRSWTVTDGSAVPPLVQSGLSNPPRAIGIGASTGGIHALTAFLEQLGQDIIANPVPAPIFVTQHLPADFLPFLAEQLNRQCVFPVEVARPGTVVRNGCVYLASGDGHLTLGRNAQRQVEIKISRDACRHNAFPAVDPMFVALAETYGAFGCGIVLSGMGRDGLTGAQAIVRAGGSVIAQDSASCVVWGMPGVVAQAGLACLIASPIDAAKAIRASWEVKR